jgi:hypothetical protein
VTYRNFRPDIIILDEFDTVIRMLKQYEDDYAEMMKKEKIDLVDLKKLREHLKIKDLLTLFQGPVPIYNRFIVATTNDFDYIKEACPALVRPGRLTPLKFDYWDMSEFNMMYEHYFGEKYSGHFASIDKPPSEILQAVKYCKTKEAFDAWLINNLRL